MFVGVSVFGAQGYTGKDICCHKQVHSSDSSRRCNELCALVFADSFYLKGRGGCHPGSVHS